MANWIIPATVAAISGTEIRAISRMPHGVAGHCIVTVTGTFVPPIVRTWMIVIPGHQMPLMPVEIVIQPDANWKSSPERKAITALIIHFVRLVIRQINDVRIHRKNFNRTAVIDDLLLRRGLQVTEIIGRRPQALDGIHHVLLLIEKSLSHFRRPTEVIVQPLQNIGVVRQRLDARIPRLLVGEVRIPAAREVTIGHDNLGRQRGCRQNLRHQWIGIKRDWPQHLVQLLRRKRLIVGHRRRDGFLR